MHGGPKRGEMLTQLNSLVDEGVVVYLRHPSRQGYWLKTYLHEQVIKEVFLGPKFNDALESLSKRPPHRFYRK